MLNFSPSFSDDTLVQLHSKRNRPNNKHPCTCSKQGEKSRSARAWNRMRRIAAAAGGCGARVTLGGEASAPSINHGYRYANSTRNSGKYERGKSYTTVNWKYEAKHERKAQFPQNRKNSAKFLQNCAASKIDRLSHCWSFPSKQVITSWQLKTFPWEVHG